MSGKRDLTRGQIADLVERFLDDRLANPQEWTDFVECRQRSAQMDEYRRICDELDPLINSHEPQDPDAIKRARALVFELRNQSSKLEPTASVLSPKFDSEGQVMKKQILRLR